MGKREINSAAAPACAAHGQSNVQLYGTADAMVYSKQLAGEKRVSCIDSDPFFARSSWVGLQDRWGTLRLGRQSTLAFVNLVRFNAFGGSSVFSPSVIKNYKSSATQPLMTPSGTAESAWNNTIGYTTPDITGLTASVFYAPSESTTAGRRLAFATCSSVLRG